MKQSDFDALIRDFGEQNVGEYIKKVKSKNLKNAAEVLRKWLTADGKTVPRTLGDYSFVPTTTMKTELPPIEEIEEQFEVFTAKL